MKEKFIPVHISEKILTIGPGDYEPYKGGIGYLVNVYYKNFGVFKYLKTHEFKYFRKKWPIMLFFLKQYSKYIKILVSDRKIKIIHIHGASYGSFYRKYILFLTAKYLFGKKVVYHINGSEFAKFYSESGSVGKRMIRHYLNNADLVLCVSESWKQFFKSNFQPKRVEVLGNVIQKPEIDKSVWSQKSNAVPEKVTFLFLGLIGYRKGVFDLLEAVVQHKEYLAGKFHLIIGGNGEEERLEKYLVDNNLLDMVKFEGWVSGEKKHELLLNSNVYILPTYNEGMPLAILEAMSYHLPIISTPVGGIAEIVLEEQNGYLVTPGNITEIFGAIDKFIKDPRLVGSMGNRSADIVEQYYDENIFPILLDFYNYLLKK